MIFTTCVGGGGGGGGVWGVCGGAREAVAASLVLTGFVHADPHEGNLMLDEDGRVVFLDFGLMSRVDDEIMESFATGIRACLAEVRRRSRRRRVRWRTEVVSACPRFATPTESRSWRARHSNNSDIKRRSLNLGRRSAARDVSRLDASHD